ncbi:hypothetical protein BH11BAC2_BH11BAC2_01380 [soil metagenome]
MPISNKEIFFESILAEMPGEIAVFDIQRRYIYINPKAIADKELREWIIGKTDYEYCKYKGLSMAIADQRKAIFDKVIAERKVYEWEERKVNADGTEVFHLRRMGPILNQQGELTFLIGYGMEITEQKKLANQLEENRFFLDQVLNMSPHLIFVKDIQGRFHLANKAMADLFNSTPEEVMKHTNAEIHPVENELKDYSSNDHKVINEMHSFRFEEPFTKPDGTVCWYDTIKLPLKKADGEIQILGLSTDITERKIAQEKVRKSELSMIEAQELAKTGNWEINLKTNAIEWSHGMFSIWERDPLNGPPKYEELNQVIHPEDAERVLNEVLPLNEKDSYANTEYRIITPSGIKFVRTIAKPIVNEEGIAERLIGTVMDITKEKNTDALLRFNELRLNEAQEMARSGSWEYDLIENKNYLSPTASRLLECDPDRPAPTFEEFINFLHPDDQEHLKNILLALARNGGETEAEYTVITQKGNRRIFYSKAVAEKDVNGLPFKLYGTMTDITERKETEHILRLNEQRLTEAQEMAKIGSWEYDLINHENRWSLGHYKLWDRDPVSPAPSFEEFVETIHPDDREKMKYYMHRALEFGEDGEVEYRVTTFKGRQRIMHSKAVVEKKNGGEISRIFGSVADITDQKRAEVILLQNEQRLIEAQELAKMGSWELFPDFTVQWSSGCYTIWERDPAMGPLSLKEHMEALHPDDREFVQKRNAEFFKSSGSGEFTYRIITPSGTEKVILSITKTQTNEEGKIIKYFGTITDITQQKKAEQELINAKKEAEESIRAKEYFLANVGHELRTPLNGILGMSRLLNKTELTSTQRNYIEILNSTASNLLMIINDILDITKIESGTLIMESMNFNPVQISDTAVQTQLYKAEEKDLVLRHMNEGDPLPLVIGDPYRLNQILLNLLNNAIKFTEQGEVVLMHKIRSQTDETIVIEFSVKDTGIGIPLKARSSIFDSFTQLNSSAQNKYGGTGLGLSISKNLVEKQGGKIWVESTPGKGSDFRFFIPYQRAAAVLPNKIPAPIDPVMLGPLRILLAEDNRVNQYITEAILQDWGFVVDIASNGSEAVEYVKRNDYDLVLMDIQMPELNGIEATRLIREMDDVVKSGLPIIALTANTTRNAQKKFIQEGLNDCLIKPFKEDTLFRKIALHIKGKERLASTIHQPRFPQRKRPVSSKEKLYDLSLLKRDARDNPQFMMRMLSLFIESIPPIIEKMQDHFAKGEMDAISTLAHKIKPTLDGAGIFSLKETIRNIENYRDKKRTRDQLKTDILNLEDVILIVIQSFRKEMEQLEQ